MKISSLALIPLLLLAVGCIRINPPPPKPVAMPVARPPIVVQPQTAPPLQTGTLPDTLPPGVIDAKDATGVWNQSQVEQYLKDDLKLTTVSLESTGGANYRGLRTNADGVSYTLDVRQVPGGIKCEFTTDTGNSGSIAFGNPVP